MNEKKLFRTWQATFSKKLVRLKANLKFPPLRLSAAYGDPWNKVNYFWKLKFKLFFYCETCKPLTKGGLGHSLDRNVQMRAQFGAPYPNNKSVRQKSCWYHHMVSKMAREQGSIFAQLTSCLTGLDSGVLKLSTDWLVWQIQTIQTGGQPYSETSPNGTSKSPSKIFPLCKYVPVGAVWLGKR